MSHNNTKDIEIYQRHRKDAQQDILMSMTNIFEVEDMIYAAVWKLICNSSKIGIPREKRRDYVMQIVNTELEKWL